MALNGTGNGNPGSGDAADGSPAGLAARFVASAAATGAVCRTLAGGLSGLFDDRPAQC